MDHSAKAVSRIIWQYRNSPKFIEWIKILPEIANVEFEATLEELSRILDFDNINEALFLLDIGDGSVFAVDDDTLFAFYEFGVESELLNIVGRIVNQPRQGFNDQIYKVLIKSKIYKNNSDASIDSIIEAAEVITGTDVFVLDDGQDMSFSLIFNDPIDPVIKNLLLTFDIIPRPQGVKLSGIIEPSEPPNFGFSELGEDDPDNILGFSELVDGVSDEEGGQFAELFGV